ncbi:MAG: hypothetical protein WC236_13675 [Gallionellaceae bacterium]|jgi:hypothetical protein
MNVKQITIAFLNAGGFDGLCSAQCGCSLDDFMPCGGDRDISECKPAMKHVCDGKCGDCMDSAEEVKSWLHACYRPAKIEVNEEETHL